MAEHSFRKAEVLGSTPRVGFLQARQHHGVVVRSGDGWPGSVKENVLPSPTFDSTQILPPWRSTIFLQIASPMPEPAYFSRV
jgi:hypothetical protein